MNRLIMRCLAAITAAFLLTAPVLAQVTGSSSGSGHPTISGTPTTGHVATWSSATQLQDGGTPIALNALTDSWTNSGTTYSAFNMTVTNTASHAGSTYFALNNNVDGNVFSVGYNFQSSGDADFYVSNLSNRCLWILNGPPTSATGNTQICNSQSSYIGNSGNPGTAGAGLGFRVNVIAKTSNFVIAPTTTSNTYWDNTGAGGEVDFTLPTSAQTVAGQRQCFTVVVAQTLKIIAGAGVTLYLGTTASSSGGSLSANAIGAGICLVSHSPTIWMTDADTLLTSWTAA